jgi:quercetin dioxygenase-like cupin family protein
MKKFKHSESGDRGWFVGQFEKAVFKTNACEVAYQENFAGEYCAPHTHRIATEINLITRGRVIMSGQEFGAGDIIIMEPGDVCECRYLEDTYTVVVKVPGVLDDKYLL